MPAGVRASWRRSSSVAIGSSPPPSRSWCSIGTATRSGTRPGRGSCASHEAFARRAAHSFLQKPIAHGTAADTLGGSEDRIHVEAVVAVELGERAGLAEVLDTERAHAVAADAAEP